MVGKTLGHHEILAPLGSGGMGEVYRARDTKLDRDVAIKVLPDDLAADPDRLARFEREAKLLASLNHANIAAIYGLEDADGVRFLVLELIEGESLEQRLRKGAVPVSEALDIARQIAEALEAAHDAGIIHRDVKPANVLLTAKGGVKVLDFGIAKSTRFEPNAALTEQATSLTVDGTLMGTPPYMAPEQIRGEEADKRADIWAFGCVVYEMLTGRAAFARETVADTLVAVLEQEPDWDALPRGAPSAAGAVLRRCLRKDRNRRIRDIGDAKIEIEDAYESPSLPTQVAAAVPSPRAWSVLVPWGLAFLAIAVAVVVGATRTGDSPGESLRAAALPRDVELRLRINQSPPFALSPDGSTLVYWQVNADGQGQLYSKSFDQLYGSPIAEPGTVGGQTSLTFSPDGEEILFENDDQLWRMRAEGGAPVKVAELPGGIGSGLRGSSWGPDGTIILGLVGEGIGRVSQAGGERELLTEPEPGLSHRWPQLLPGGKGVVFTIGAGNYDEARIGILDIETRSVSILEGLRGTYPRYVSSGHLLFARADSLFAVPFDAGQQEVKGPEMSVLDGVAVNTTGNGSAHYAVADNGHLVYAQNAEVRREFVLVAPDGSYESLGFPVQRFGGFDVSHDGKLIAAVVSTGADQELHILDLEGSERALVTPPMVFQPVWSRSGENLFFAARESGRLQIFSIPADGSLPASSIYDGPGRRYPNTSSPDDAVLVFQQQEATWDIYAVDRSNGDPLEKIVATEQHEGQARFAPDGRYLAYSSSAAGRLEVYVLPYPNDGSWGALGKRISANGGHSPIWGSGGEELFFIEGRRMMTVRFRTDPEFAPQTPVPLFELTDELIQPLSRDFAPGYGIGPDRQHFILLRHVGERPRSLVIQLNWFEELERLVPTGR